MTKKIKQAPLTIIWKKYHHQSLNINDKSNENPFTQEIRKK